MYALESPLLVNLTTVTTISLSLISGLILIYLVQRKIIEPHHDSREPPIIRSWVPGLGHVGSLLMRGTKHFTDLCQQHDYPVFTVPLFKSKVYVVSSPALAAQVQRNPKTMVFELVASDSAVRMSGVGTDVKHLLEKGFASKDKAERDECLLNVMHDYLLSSLSPSEALDELGIVQLNEMVHMVGQIDDSSPVDMFVCIRHIVSTTNMLALYGPKHIFTNPELVDCFWNMESNLPRLLATGMPSLIAPKAYADRERLKKAMVEYAEKGYIWEASKFMRGRFQILIDKGFSITGAAAEIELSFMHGIMVNVTPTAFWMLMRLYTNASFLSSVRRELEQSDIVRIDGLKRFISISKLKAQCPSLVSVFRECLRYYTHFLNNRIITEDTFIDNYLFKKGYSLQICGPAMHSDPEIWGSDVDEFDPLRFATSPFGTIKSSTPTEPAKKVHAAALRSFGGGRAHCPGRHFALTEATGFVALVVLGWDLLPADGTELKLLPKEETKLPTGVSRPDGDIKVLFQGRKGLEDVQWSFER
ncbi:hypothetical protein FKW77_007965 [Venturia effusa]|uniref:Cytochrome P450 n=1 Tax=Venturia effusa TaxID=50376 RepID=A0A517KZU4_9PEZI|nr:hypothetical protein FKW77_007965 [Venturia effusa]